MQSATQRAFLGLCFGALSCLLVGCNQGGADAVAKSDSNAASENHQHGADSPDQDVALSDQGDAASNQPGSLDGEDAQRDALREGLGNLAEPNEFAIASYNEGVMSLQRGDYKGAIEKFNLAIELSPLFALAFNNRGIAHAKVELYDRALDDFEEAVLIDPKLFDAYKNAGAAGAMAVDGNALEHAIRLCRFALERHRSGRTTGAFDETWIPKTYNNLGLAYSKGEQSELAIESFEAALKVDPAFADAERNLALARQLKNAITASRVDAKELCIAHTLYYLVLSLAGVPEKEREEMVYEEPAKFYGIPKRDVAIILSKHASKHMEEATALMFSEAEALQSLSKDSPSFKSVVEMLRQLSGK